MMKKILIIEDDQDLAAITKDMLMAYGYHVEIVNTCEDAYEIINIDKFHLLLLDINLPDGTGFSLCKELRKVSDVPILFASARTSINDKTTGLDIGGDDYLEKPYSLKELLARINAIMRRAYGKQEEMPVYCIGNLCIDCGQRSVTKEGEEIKLSLKEFDVLAYLCAHAGEIVHKEDILREVWGIYSEVEIATVAVHIRWLREKLEDDPSHPTYIETIWGIGYRFHRNIAL